MEFDDLSKRVIGCAIEVHRELGPGLLESTYEQCLAREMKLNGIAFQLQHPQPVQYKGTGRAQTIAPEQRGRAYSNGQSLVAASCTRIDRNSLCRFEFVSLRLKWKNGISKLFDE